MKFKLLAIFNLVSIAVMAQNSANNNGLAVVSSIPRDTIIVGDQIEYKIAVTVPGTYKVFFPILSDSLAKGIELIHKPSIDSLSLNNGSRQFQLKAILSSYDSGLFTIPSMPIIINKGMEIDTMLTDSIFLAVNLMPIDTSVKELYDIKKPISEPLTFAEVAPWTIGGLLLIGVLVLLYYYLKSRRQNKPFQLLRKPMEPPHVIALRELEKIRHDKLWASEHYKYYHTRLIDVVRQYIERRFEVSAMEQTTDEILRDLKRVDLNNQELLSQLQEVLSLSDLVKFAKFRPSLSENEHSLNFAFEFVQKTKREEIPQKETEKENDVIDGGIPNNGLTVTENSTKTIDQQ